MHFLQNLLILLFCFTALAEEKKPNIVLFMADDFGCASINAHGASESFVKTPHLNSLVQEGMNFINAFASASVCTPTRYTMLTGQYSWRTKLKSGVVNTCDPLLISRETVTIGKYLQDIGYRTAAVGKWHLGYKESKFENLLGKISPGPNDIGFNYHFGVPNNLDDVHKVYIENDRIFELKSDKIQSYGESFYRKPYFGYDATQRKCDEVMDFTTQKAINWIADESQKQPFFMYYAAAAVHHPITPSSRMKGKSGAGLYGDFIQDVDYSVGQFIKALKDKGLYENTIFIFTSDNGGDLPVKAETPERQAYDKGFKFNGKFRADKHTIFEGGLKVPFIVNWPKQVNAGLQTASLVSTADIFSTLAEATNGTVPSPEIAAPDSFSFYAVLKNPQHKAGRPFLINRDAKGIQAIRQGKWKYVDDYVPAANRRKVSQNKKMLFDLEKDPSETSNCIKAFPEVASELQKLLIQARQNSSTRKLHAGSLQ